MYKSKLNWDQYFMSVSKISALRSKDPSTKVGACVVNNRKRIIAIGYNGLPFGMDDQNFHWEKREGKYEETKYPYIVHAEANAILNATTNLENSTIYVSLFPCHECGKLIIQSGIKEVVYESDKYADQSSFIISRKMLNDAGVKLTQIETCVNVDVQISKNR